MSKKQKTPGPLPRAPDISVDRARGSFRSQYFSSNRIERIARGSEDSDPTVASDQNNRVGPIQLGRLSRGQVSTVFGVEVLSDASCPVCSSRSLECYMVIESPGTAAGPNQGFSQRYRERASRSIVVACGSCGVEGKGADVNEAIERFRTNQEQFRKAGVAPGGVLVPSGAEDPPDVISYDEQLYIKERRETPEDEEEFLQDRIQYLRGLERGLSDELSKLEYRIEIRETDVQDLENKVQYLTKKVRTLESRTRDLSGETVSSKCKWLDEQASSGPMTQDAETSVPILDPPYVVDGLDASSGLGAPDGRDASSGIGTPIGETASSDVNVKPDGLPDSIMFRGKSFKRKST